MIDFIEITTHLCKGSPNLGQCKEHPTKKNTYYLQGVCPMQVFWKSSTGLLKVSGSLPKYLQGHNFTFPLQRCFEAINQIETSLQIHLMVAEVTTFEFGVVFPVPTNPKDYIRHHYCKRGSKLLQVEKYNGLERYWADTSTGKRTAPLVIKLYDAGKRLKTTTTKQIRDTIPDYNPQLDYIKLEIHYNKPHLLNRGLGLRLMDLLDTNWQDALQVELLEQYSRLMITKEFAQPKRKPSAVEIAVRVIVDYMVNNEGKSVEDAKKAIKDKMKEIDNLNKGDRQGRNKTFNSVFAKLQELSTSQWDLGSRIMDALCLETLQSTSTGGNNNEETKKTT